MKAHDCAIVNSVSAHKFFFDNRIVEHTTLYTHEKSTDLPLLNSNSIEDDINAVRDHNNFVENKLVLPYTTNKETKNQEFFVHNNFFENQIVEHTTPYMYEKSTESPLFNSKSIQDDIISVRDHNNFVENKFVQLLNKVNKTPEFSAHKNCLKSKLLNTQHLIRMKKQQTYLF